MTDDERRQIIDMIRARAAPLGQAAAAINSADATDITRGVWP